MRLWTIQPIEVYEILKEKGVFTCEEEKSELFKDFKNSYDWLIGKMDEKNIEHPNDINYPIWAWHTRDWKNKKPDLREGGYGERGTKSVCLELEISDDRVLLSDFDLWHYVLNHWFIDDSTNEEEWEEIHQEFEKKPYEEREKLILESWNKIFNVKPFIIENWITIGRYVQATFWELKMEDVKKVQFFTCK